MQILSVGFSSGPVAAFLASLPQVYSSHGSCTAFLSSLQEVTISGDGKTICSVAVECEPTFVALGPKHVAVGINNQVR